MTPREGRRVRIQELTDYLLEIRFNLRMLDRELTELRRRVDIMRRRPGLNVQVCMDDLVENIEENGAEYLWLKDQFNHTINQLDALGADVRRIVRELPVE